MADNMSKWSLQPSAAAGYTKSPAKPGGSASAGAKANKHANTPMPSVSYAGIKKGTW